MAGFDTELARNVNLQLGSNDFGPFLIDDDVKSFGITFDRANWTDPTARLDVNLEISINQGPFTILGGLVASGGAAPPPPRPNVTFLTITLP